MRIVDAANVIGSRPDGWWRDRAGAAEKLLQSVHDALETGRLPGPVVVVLEGRARSARREAAAGASLDVVRAPGSGDDRIVELVEEAAAAGTVPTVVTADRELRRRVISRGAFTQGPQDFLAELGGERGHG